MAKTCGRWPMPTATKPMIRLLDQAIRSQADANRGRGSVYTCRSTIIALISAIALAGLRLFGQALAQFMMVWQR